MNITIPEILMLIIGICLGMLIYYFTFQSTINIHDIPHNTIFTIDDYTFILNDTIPCPDVPCNGLYYPNNTIYLKTPVRYPICIHEILHSYLNMTSSEEHKVIEQIQDKIKIDVCDELMEKLK